MLTASAPHSQRCLSGTPGGAELARRPVVYVPAVSTACRDLEPPAGAIAFRSVEGDC